jgi:hypothetical protein
VALAFAAALAAVLYIDVYRTLTFRLLAENLVFPLWPALLMLAFRAQATGKPAYFVAAGAVSGLCFLVRANLMGIGLVLAAVVWWFAPPPTRTSRALAILLGWLAVSSLLPIRNYVVTSQVQLTVVTQSTDWAPVTNLRRTNTAWHERMSQIAEGYAKRIAYTLGIPYFLQPTFRVRPHWLLLWGGGFWYLSGLRRRPMPMWEAVVAALCAAYFVPILLIGYVSSYATRTLAPGLPLLAMLVFAGFERSAADYLRSRSVSS